MGRPKRYMALCKQKLYRDIREISLYTGTAFPMVVQFISLKQVARKLQFLSMWGFPDLALQV